MVKAIIALARELRLRVTVEGVETAEQAAFLCSSDGDQAQGYYYGRPVTAAEAAEIIMADRRKHADHGQPAPAVRQPERLGGFRDGRPAFSASQSGS